MEPNEHDRTDGFDVTDINRRKLLQGVGAAGAIGVLGTGSASAKGQPCFKDFKCSDDGIYVKFEFVEEDDECTFEEETDTDLITIDGSQSKDGEDCEPTSVDWSVEDGYEAAKVMAYGGQECDKVEDLDSTGGTFEPELENSDGNTAAISNLQFCLEEDGFPECPFYGTSREDPTAIVNIRYDSDADEITENVIGDIPDDSDNSNYPNGLAFDDGNDVWYFAEENGTLKTMNEDGSLGIEGYGVITPGGESVAGATFHDGLYYFIPNDGDELWTANISDGSVSTTKVDDLSWSGIGLGDLAVDEDDTLYVSTVSSNEGSIFFRVDLTDTESQTLISDGEPDAFATSKQLAFENDTLWAHTAGGGNWYTVDLTDGSLSDLVETTNEYTDLASCGEAEWES